MASSNPTSKTVRTSSDVRESQQLASPALLRIQVASKEFHAAIKGPTTPPSATGITGPTNILAGVSTSATYTEKALFVHLLRDHQDEVAGLKRELGEMKREVGRLEGEKGELEGLVGGLRGDVEELRRELASRDASGGEGMGKKRKVRR